MRPLPRISIVTPSFNQAAYLEETIDSVLGQNYPHLEYIVMDGGSTDGSVDIIRKYEKRLTFWQSQPDNGQADAIVQGFRRATGEILGWINSDDFYFPGSLRYAAASLDPAREQLLFGNCFHFVEGTSRGMPSNIDLKHTRHRLDLISYLVQPSTFWTRRLADRTGELDVSLNYAFDWEWFVRAQKAGAEFVPSTRYLSAYRIHSGHKSSGGGDKRYREIREVYARNHPPDVVAAIDFCHQNYRDLDRWRRRFRRWPLFRRGLAECLLKNIYGSALKVLRADDLRDVLDMIAPDAPSGDKSVT